MVRMDRLAALEKARQARSRDGQERSPLEVALASPRSRDKAIAAKCWDCCGRLGRNAWRKEVLACQARQCPLWHLRTATVHKGGRKKASGVASVVNSG